MEVNIFVLRRAKRSPFPPLSFSPGATLVVRPLSGIFPFRTVHFSVRLLSRPHAQTGRRSDLLEDLECGTHREKVRPIRRKPRSMEEHRTSNVVVTKTWGRGQ